MDPEFHTSPCTIQEGYESTIIYRFHKSQHPRLLFHQLVRDESTSIIVSKDFIEFRPLKQFTAGHPMRERPRCARSMESNSNDYRLQSTLGNSSASRFRGSEIGDLAFKLVAQLVSQTILADWTRSERLEMNDNRCHSRRTGLVGPILCVLCVHSLQWSPACPGSPGQAGSCEYVIIMFYCCECQRREDLKDLVSHWLHLVCQTTVVNVSSGMLTLQVQLQSGPLVHHAALALDPQLIMLLHKLWTMIQLLTLLPCICIISSSHHYCNY